MFWRRLSTCSVYLVIFFVFFPAGGQGPDSGLDDFQIAARVFAEAGVPLEEIRLQAWGQTRALTAFPETPAEYRLLCAELGIDRGNVSIQRVNDNTYTVTAQQTGLGDAVLHLTVQPALGTNGERVTSLDFRLVSGDSGEAYRCYQAMSSYFSALGWKERIGVSFSGTFYGKPERESLGETACYLAGKVKAAYVEGIEEERVASLCYYTPKSHSFLKIGERKVNLNIALRYQEGENRTYLYVGAPLIYGDY